MSVFEDEKLTLSYDDIADHFGETTIANRFKYIYEKMNQYIIERGLESRIAIDEGILHQAVMDYFADIYRIKKFHNIDRVNLNKINGYEIYWLLRRKPLQIISQKESERFVFVNEGFLTVFIAHECLMPDESAPRTEEQENAFLLYLEHIYYCLKYRNIDKQWLETVLYSVDVGKVLGR